MPKRRDRHISVWQLLAILIAAVVVIVGLAAVVTSHRPPGVDWSDAIRSIGFLAAAVVAVPVGYIAYRRQRTQEQQHTLAAGQEDRASRQEFRERFVSATTQVGSDSIMARIAGVYALANLADEWGMVEDSQRQVCIDVLCAYLRTSYDPAADNLTTETIEETASSGTRSDKTTISDKRTTRRAALRDDRDVRLTIIRLIRDHLLRRPGIPNGLPGDPPHEPGLWGGCTLNFTGAVIPAGADFSGADFTGTQVSFDNATFSDGRVSFDSVSFGGGQVSFDRATFTGGSVSFEHASFFEGAVTFRLAQFTGGTVSFHRAVFSGSAIWFHGAAFTGGRVTFNNAMFFKGEIGFNSATFFGGSVTFHRASLGGGALIFDGTRGHDGSVTFDKATWSGTVVTRNGETFRGWPRP